MISNENNNDNDKDSFFLIDENEDLINLYPKMFSLFNNFLIKESKAIYPKQKLSPEKEIMPEYHDIDTQIQKKISDIRNFYGLAPIFKEMQSKNSYAMTIFKKGFKQLFFGSKGIVTRKSIDLKNYYKSLEPKTELNSKIYAGSLDYYDFLSSYNSFFERLKNSRKRMLKISGNFSVSNTSSDKLHAAYAEYEKKRRKKNILIKGKNKKNSLNYFNDANNKTNNANLDKDIKNKTRSNFYSNTYTKNKNNLFNLEKKKSNEEMRKTHNIFLNYKKNSETINNNEHISKKNLNSIFNKSLKSNFLSIQTEDNINNKIRNDRKEKTEIFPKIREDKKHLTNITTISNKNEQYESSKNAKPNLYKNLILKSPIKKKKSFIVQTPNKISRKNINNTNLFNNSKINNKNPIQIEGYSSNKSLRFHRIDSLKKEKKENNKKHIESLESIRLSIKNQLDSTIPKNKKFVKSINKFIDNNKKYELKKKDLLKQKIKEEILELKEDMKSTGKYSNDIPKNVDFSDIKGFSPKNNHKVNNKLKGASFNLAFSFKSRFEQNLPIKDFLLNIEKLKEKEKEAKFLKYIRKNFKKNIKHIHNLTISLDNIKKKYNY